MTVYGIELGLSCARIARPDPAGGAGAIRVGAPDDGAPVLPAAVAFRTLNERLVGRAALECDLPDEALRVPKVRRLLERADDPAAGIRAHEQS
jgi:molecular chaperone DnaK (HSP70)